MEPAAAAARDASSAAPRAAAATASSIRRTMRPSGSPDASGSTSTVRSGRSRAMGTVPATPPGTAPAGLAVRTLSPSSNWSPVSPSIAAVTKPGRGKRRRRQRHGRREELLEVGAQLGVEEPDHDPDLRVELLGGERGGQVAEVAVVGQDDGRSRRDARLGEDPCQAMIALDDACVVDAHVRRSLGGRGDDDHRLAPQSELVHGPYPEVVDSADDHVTCGGHSRSVRGCLGRSPPPCGIIPASWARSSMAEQLTLNQRVEGSSPSGLTTSRERDMAPRRRRRETPTERADRQEAGTHAGWRFLDRA